MCHCDRSQGRCDSQYSKENINVLINLHLKNIGPAPEMMLELSPRLNILTGDNGLGKTFLLDVIWWALTRKWPHELNEGLTSGYPAKPSDPNKAATISFEIDAKKKRAAYESSYKQRDQAWVGKAGRPPNPGLVIYALADGGFAVWDPARNYWKTKGSIDVQERHPAYIFSNNNVWDGLSIKADGKTSMVCNGLIADWSSWIKEQGEDALRMRRVLMALAPPAQGASLELGKSFARLSLDDVRDIPTIRMGTQQDIPILHASLGVRRITALSYMLSWAWREHLLAAAQLGEPPSTRLVLLFDEVEAHLHPRWQRAILPALLNVAQTLTDAGDASVQIIASTHSPLVLASLEPHFEQERDAWFDLDFEDERAVLRKRPFLRHGDASSWLTSDAFDLTAARSIEAEAAITTALALLRSDEPELDALKSAHRALQASLSDIDRFWVRWAGFYEDTLKRRGHNPS